MTGLVVTLTTGERLVFSREELLSPAAFRESMFEQTGCMMPRYSPAEHELVIRALVALPDAPVPLVPAETVTSA